MPNTIYTSSLAPSRYGDLVTDIDCIVGKMKDKHAENIVSMINHINTPDKTESNYLPHPLRQATVAFGEDRDKKIELDWLNPDNENATSCETLTFTLDDARDAVRQILTAIFDEKFSDVLNVATLDGRAYFIVTLHTAQLDDEGASEIIEQADQARTLLRVLDASGLFVKDIKPYDDNTEELLRAMCESIANQLGGENRDDFYTDRGYYLNEDDEWRDEDGDEVNLDGDGYPELDQSYVSLFLEENYGIRVTTMLGDENTYYGAEVCVACGGPNIWINTNTRYVEGYWGSTKIEVPYIDHIGFDDEVELMFEAYSRR